MFTVVITAVIVIGLATLLYLGRGRVQGSGRRGLKRRFGLEYARTVAHHDGDAKAAEQELGKRVERHGSLTERPLSPDAREYYVAQWAAAQEQFVASPQQAVTEADALIAGLARDRGFPDGEQFEDQISALSVHHAHYAHYVQGYCSMHTAAREQSGATASKPRTATNSPHAASNSSSAPASHSIRMNPPRLSAALLASPRYRRTASTALGRGSTARHQHVVVAARAHSDRPATGRG
ncbi:MULTISPECIES: hypothetical protein [unclassified Streptomyces]|uniref:hypothetical protein n=1 Tax=unclassified Streptomyces TaxID=2593676 RepID=UPI002254BCF9|nr:MULTISPECIES: hypothetical protein [unclassified Streptomyces]MCX5049990.1 hypothetical protein [Streptomyces sp. NBC_00474]